jgi:hypothetical protein
VRQSLILLANFAMRFDCGDNISLRRETNMELKDTLQKAITTGIAARHAKKAKLKQEAAL